MGHAFIFKALTATGFRENGEPVNDVFVPNATAIKINILIPGKKMESQIQ